MKDIRSASHISVQDARKKQTRPKSFFVFLPEDRMEEQTGEHPSALSAEHPVPSLFNFVNVDTDDYFAIHEDCGFQHSKSDLFRGRKQKQQEVFLTEF